jgi:hypothetical protein
MEVTTNDENVRDVSISDNFFEDFVTFSRSKMVMNERQAMVVQMVIASAFLDDWRDYNSCVVTGSAAGGKSHMLREVTVASLDYAEEATDGDFLYELTGGSDKAAVDDDELDEAMAAYLHEMNKIPDEMMEMIKSLSEDGGFKYGRNVADDESESGRTTVKIEKEPIPILFAFADENEDSSGDDTELRSRLVEVKVDENEEKNRAVHKQKWGSKNLELPSASGKYIFDDPETEHAVKAHMRDVPRGINVVYPTGEGRFSGDTWHAGEVTAPMFNFKRSESTRASAYLGSLAKGSTVLNYHNRPTWCEDCGNEYTPDESRECEYVCECGEDLQLIMQPQDVGNLIDCRNVLMATTHNLTSKKFAIIDAIVEDGGPATTFDNVSSAAVMAEKQDIYGYIQAADDIATMSKYEIDSLLDELNDELLIQKRDHPDNATKNVYVFDGADIFQRPRIAQYYDAFESVTSPVSGDDITSVIDRQLERLNATMDTSMEAIETAADAMSGASSNASTIDSPDSQESNQSASQTADGSLSAFSDDNDDLPSEVSETAQRVCERLHDTLDGVTVPSRAQDDLQLSHMLGVTPLDRDGNTVTPARQPNGGDRVDSFMSPDEWDECESFDEVDELLTQAVGELRAEGYFEIGDDGEITVDCSQ